MSLTNVKQVTDILLHLVQSVRQTKGWKV